MQRHGAHRLRPGGSGQREPGRARNGLRRGSPPATGVAQRYGDPGEALVRVVLRCSVGGPPLNVVKQYIEQQNRPEVVADEWSAYVKASLAGDPSAFYTATVTS